MSEAARKLITSPQELESQYWAEVVCAHDAVLRCSEQTREAAWDRFLNALSVFLAGGPNLD